MDIFTILKANIRRQKGSFFSIFILMFIVSLCLNAVLTISINSYKSDAESLEYAGFGDMLVLLDGRGVDKGDELIRRVENHSEVEKVQKVPAVCGNFKEINGKKSSNSVMIIPYDEKVLNYHIFNKEGTGYIDTPQRLKEGEMYLPICYTNTYGCKVGDKITFRMSDRDESYRIKGFFEDPFMGSSMMGIKTLLTSDADIEKMQKEAAAGTERSLNEGMMMNIFQKENSSLSYLRFEQELNKDTDVAGYAWLTLGTEQSMGFMMILVKIFSGSLMVFIVLLLIITLIIMSHSIGSSIEMEYVNLGILKALGVSQGKLKLILMLQYLLGAASGALLGIPFALPVIKAVNQIMVPVVGFLTPNHLAFLPCIGAMMGIMGFLVLFIWLKMYRLKHITPVRAICGGRENIYFSNPLQMPVRKKGMSFWLAIRQLTSNGKQYVGAGIITGLLVFFMIMVGHMNSWMGADGDELAAVFDAEEHDLWIQYYDTSLQEEVEEKIRSYSEIEKQYQVQNVQLMLDGCKIVCFVCEAPEEIISVLEGRTCLYDNEILITQFVADNLELQIGDTVMVGEGEKEAEYIVSGIYQCGNDLGNNFAMSKAGYERIGSQILGEAYRLKHPEKAEEIGKELNKIYDTKIRAAYENGFNGMEAIVAAVEGLSALVYVLALIFVLVVISLVCGKVFAKEQQDNGIYKSLGFTSKNLRLQFALRFTMVSLLGSGVGVILTLLLMNKCFGVMLYYVGISQIDSTIEWIHVFIPVGIMAVVFFLFSYWKAGKIKKVEPRVLITE